MKISKRYWEIDTVRAQAFLLMFIQHTAVLWNGVFTGNFYSNEFFNSIGRTGAILFFIAVGISGYISYSTKISRQSFSAVSNIFLKRGTILVGLGFLISIVVFLVIPSRPILFGVLSFIGLSTILLPYFIYSKYLSWILLFTAPLMGYFLSSVDVTTMSLLIFGIYPSNFESLDYWPLIPWISVILIGLEIGRKLYPKGVSKISLPKPESRYINVIQWVGSHTLILYILHIPVLYLLFSCIMYVLS